MRISRWGMLGVGGVFAVACASGVSDEAGRVHQAIVGGSADTTHPATVSLLLIGPQSGRCSGTIVKTDGDHGTILTSAHCFELSPTKVTIATGADFNAPTATFQATSWKLYPTTSASLFDSFHDLALVEFDGATGLPVMPMVKPADYASYTTSSTFTIIGYGRVSLDASVTNSLRKKLDVTLDKFQETWILDHGPDGSTCFGDSGGTVIDDSTGTERLAAVTQGGNCQGDNDQNASVAFYAPEISQWLRDNGFDMPTAPTLPNGADCATNDALCHSGACLHFKSNTPAGFLDLCGDPVPNNVVCQRSAQCQSHFCNAAGGCTDAPDSGGIDAGVVDAGTDSGATKDAGADAGVDAGGDAGADAGADAGVDAGGDAGTDAGEDASTSGGSSSSSSSTSSGGTSSSSGATSSSGTTVDASVPAPAADDDSGCSTSNGSERSAGWGALFLFALVVRLRRKR